MTVTVKADSTRIQQAEHFFTSVPSSLVINTTCADWLINISQEYIENVGVVFF